MTGRGSDISNDSTTTATTGGVGQGADGGIPAPAPFGAAPASPVLGAATRPVDTAGQAPETAVRPAIRVTPDKGGSGWNHPKVTSIVAGAGAAATSTLIGGHLGAVGTVIGAALASIITTLALNIYENTLRSGTHRLRRVWRRHHDDLPESAEDTADAATTDSTRPAPGGGRLPIRISRRMVLVTGLTALAATALGLGLMVGLEHGSATPITPGTSQLAGTGKAARTSTDTSTTGQDRQGDSTGTTGTGSGTDGAASTKATPSTAATPAQPSASSSARSGAGSSSSTGTGGTSGSGSTGSGTSGSGTSGTDGTSGTGTGSGSGGSTGSGSTGSGTTG